MSTAPSNLKMLAIVHKAMMIGEILFGTVLVLLVSSGTVNLNQPELDRPLQVAALLISAVGFFAGNMLFKKKLLQARELQDTAAVKFAAYRTAATLQWAMMEGPGLFNIICFFLTGNYAFIALAAVLLLLFSMMGPQRSKVQFLLGLNEEEMNTI